MHYRIGNRKKMNGENMRLYEHMIWASLLLVSIVGCYSEPNEPKGKAKDQGREETKMIEAVGAVGYDGKAIRQQVDKLLDDTEKRNRELEEVMKKASGESN